MLINLTTKAAKALKLKEKLKPKEAVSEDIPPSETWYCNVLEVYSNAIDLWFTHAETRFSFPLILLQPPDAELLDHMVRDSLRKMLTYYKVDAKHIDQFMIGSRKISYFVGPKDRKLLGIATNMKQTIQDIFDEAYETGHSVNWKKIMVSINSMLFGAPNYQIPIIEFVRTYSGRALDPDTYDLRQGGKE